MGWFSNIVHTVVDDWLGIDLPDPKANAAASANASAAQQASAQQAAATQSALTEQTNALKASTALAQKTADDALATQKKALAASEAALIPTIDSESARVAGETRQRKLQSTSPWGIGMQKKLGAAPVGFRVLSGQ
jgi:hypothetical protein